MFHPLPHPPDTTCGILPNPKSTLPTLHQHPDSLEHVLERQPLLHEVRPEVEGRCVREEDERLGDGERDAVHDGALQTHSATARMRGKLMSQSGTVQDFHLFFETMRTREYLVDQSEAGLLDLLYIQHRKRLRRYCACVEL